MKGQHERAIERRAGEALHLVNNYGSLMALVLEGKSVLRIYFIGNC